MDTTGAGPHACFKKLSQQTGIAIPVRLPFVMSPDLNLYRLHVATSSLSLNSSVSETLIKLVSIYYPTLSLHSVLSHKIK